MQNEPNFPDDQMNITKVLTKNYGNKSNWTLGENEPKTNPIKANSNPIKANIMPKQTQYKANFRGKKGCSPPFCCGISKEKMILCNLINRKSQFERI